MSTCPCGSKKDYAQCCEPFIKGESIPETAEQVMRARYSSYVKAELEYLLESTHPNQRSDYDMKGTRRWAEKSLWEALEIVSVEKGGPEDSQGKVEFIAHYRHKNNPVAHHEMAEFIKEEGKWYFYQGKMVPQKQFVREQDKVGRNDPCPCGSGKKHKKCCGS
jgi:SEC-C motif domain protein